MFLSFIFYISEAYLALPSYLPLAPWDTGAQQARRTATAEEHMRLRCLPDLALSYSATAPALLYLLQPCSRAEKPAGSKKTNL